ncbi:hypothetical protein PANPB_00156 (plasmid) [Pantoea sp. Nvir]|uniref:hypothetical protein n=1 Tax=Pantoea sp. Nvir TaxID=2576760 RepID=UPI0030CE4CDD
MTPSVAKVIAGLALTFFTLFTPTFAASLMSGNALSFSGSLFQDPCQLTFADSQITFICPDKGGVSTQPLSMQQITRGNVVLPGVEKVSMAYLNSAKSKAEVRVDYF